MGTKIVKSGLIDQRFRKLVCPCAGFPFGLDLRNFIIAYLFGRSANFGGLVIAFPEFSDALASSTPKTPDGAIDSAAGNPTYSNLTTPIFRPCAIN
jgi:hypothetical protein